MCKWTLYIVQALLSCGGFLDDNDVGGDKC